MKLKNAISRVVVDRDAEGAVLDVAFYLVGSEEQYSALEFKPDSNTGSSLRAIDAIIRAQDIIEAAKGLEQVKKGTTA